ncbi:MAG: hypothetical protein E7623_06310 [Ruminococcaceae bacterium]|nr:hypothetical protein [Oscillospiraceae bacterium]
MIRHVITLTLLIFAVLLIRAIFRKKVSSRLIYALWIAVLIKLCIPFSLYEIEIPESILESGTSVTETEAAEIFAESITQGDKEEIKIPENEEQGNKVEINTGIGQQTGTAIMPELNTEGAKPPVSIIPEQNSMAETEGTSIGKDEPVFLDASDILKWLYIAGVCTMALVFGVSGIVFRIRAIRSRRYLGKYMGIKIYVSEAVNGPCLSSLFPAVYLDIEAAASPKRAYIVAHEYIHFCHGDFIWSIVRCAALILYWWHPLVWAAAILSKHDAELACDESLGRRLNRNDRFDYARVIVDTIPKRRGHAIGLGSGSLKDRIKMLTSENKHRIMAALLVIALTLSFAACSFADLIGDGKTADKEKESETENEKEHENISQEEEGLYNILSNNGGLEFKVLRKDIDRSKLRIYRYDERYKLYINCGEEDSNGVPLTLMIFDTLSGDFVAEKKSDISVLPNEISYTEDGIVLYTLRYGKDGGSISVDAAVSVRFDGKEIYTEKVAFHSAFPKYGYPIKSPDGSFYYRAVTEDNDGHGGVDIVYADGSTERILTNVMYGDDFKRGRSADIGDVRGYEPLCLTEEGDLIYNVRGYESIDCFGIYDKEWKYTTEHRGQAYAWDKGYVYASVNVQEHYGIKELFRYYREGDWNETLFSIDTPKNIISADPAFTFIGYCGDMWIVSDNSALEKLELGERDEGIIYSYLYSKDFSTCLASYSFKQKDSFIGYLEDSPEYLCAIMPDTEKRTVFCDAQYTVRMPVEYYSNEFITENIIYGSLEVSFPFKGSESRSYGIGKIDALYCYTDMLYDEIVNIWYWGNAPVYTINERDYLSSSMGYEYPTYRYRHGLNDKNKDSAQEWKVGEYLELNEYIYIVYAGENVYLLVSFIAEGDEDMSEKYDKLMSEIEIDLQKDAERHYLFLADGSGEDEEYTLCLIAPYSYLLEGDRFYDKEGFLRIAVDHKLRRYDYYGFEEEFLKELQSENKGFLLWSEGTLGNGFGYVGYVSETYNSDGRTVREYVFRCNAGDRLCLVIRFYEYTETDGVDYPNNTILPMVESLYIFDGNMFSSRLPNEGRIHLITYRINNSPVYLFLGKNRYDPKGFYVYSYRIDDSYIKFVEAYLPLELEYDYVCPIYVGAGAGSGECQIVLEIRNGDEIFYVSLDNFDYTGTEDWLYFKYRGEISDELKDIVLKDNIYLDKLAAMRNAMPDIIK